MHSRQSPRTLVTLFLVDVSALLTLFKKDFIASLPIMLAASFALVNVIASIHRTITMFRIGQQNYLMYALFATLHAPLVAGFGTAATLRLDTGDAPTWLMKVARFGAVLGGALSVVDSMSAKRLSRFLAAPIVDLLVVFLSIKP